MSLDIDLKGTGTAAFGAHDFTEEDIWAGMETERRRPVFSVETDPEPDRRSWRPVDLEPVLDGTYQAPEPTVGMRNDGVGLFYPGRVHTASSESEGGKTWLLLLAAKYEMRNGNTVVYLDFEDDEGGVVGRLLALGTEPDLIRAGFIYMRPSEPVTRGLNASDLVELLNLRKPSLAVLDGVTEAMTLHGLEINDNGDVARFSALLPRLIASTGAAVVALDHVPKSKDNRGRFAIGGQHKLAGIDGAAYVLENRTPFGIGVTGRTTVKIAKDRPGQLRRHALPSGEGLYWFADLVITGNENGTVVADLWAPKAKSEDDTGFRPTAVMSKVSKILGNHPGGLSGNAIAEAAKGRRATVLHALELLVSEGHVTIQKSGPSKVHVLARPFAAEGSDDT